MILPRAPGLPRRLASALYDLLLLAALVLVATFPFLAVFGDSTHGWRRHVLQAWVLGVAGAYFVWFWTRGGQTLPMKTWHLRVVRFDGAPLGVGRALHRYVLAALGLFAAGLGFAWALVDRDRQFLHDRLAGTALIDAGRKEPANDAVESRGRKAGADPGSSAQLGAAQARRGDDGDDDHGHAGR